MKKILIATMVLVFCGCSKKQDETIKIGVIMSLSGNGAEYGKMVLEGMECGLDEVNENTKSPKTLFIVEDDKTEPSFGVSAALKLIQIDKARVIIGPIASSVALAVSPVAEANQTVLLSPAASSPKLSDAGDYIFRIYPSDSYDGYFLADFAFENRKLKTASILYLNNEFGMGLSNTFASRFAELGGKIDYAEGFKEGSLDFRSQLAKIQHSNSAAIFLIATSKEYVTALRQIRELRIKSMVLAPVTFDDPSIIKEVGEAADGVIYSRPAFDPSKPDSILAVFSSRYRTKHGKDPSVLNALGYDAVRIIHESLRKHAFRPDSLKDGLYQMRGFPGAAGSITFDHKGDALKGLQLMIVRNKVTVPL